MKSLALKSTLALTLAVPVASLSAAPLFSLGNEVQVYGLGTVALEYQDNLFYDATNEVDDLMIRLSPGIEVQFGQSPAANAKLTYSHHFQMYDDQGTLDTDLSDFRFVSRYDSGVFLGLFNASFRELTSNTPDINRVGMLVRRDEIRVNASGKYVMSQLTAMSLGLQYDDTNYRDPVFVDSTSFGVPLTFYYRIRPTVDLTAGYRYRSTDVSIGGLSDYRDHYVFVGAEGELLSPKLTGQVSLGWQDRDYKGGTGSDGNFSYNVSVTYAATPGANIYALLSNDFRTSAQLGRTYSYGMATLGANFAVAHNVRGNTSVTYAKADYRGIRRAESHVFFDAGVTYSPNDYLSFRASYQYQDIDGNNLDGALDYTNNRFVVSASLRY
jgi:hypothetical protein